MNSARYTTVHSPAPERPGSRADAVYHGLYEELLQGQHPYGVRLAEGRIADRFGVSRTPAREALLRLEAEGHLIRHDDGGLSPNPPQISQMRDRYELRSILELAMVRRTAGAHSGTPSVALTELRTDWQRLAADPALTEATADPGFVHIDEDFHVRLAQAAGNAAVVAALRDVNDRIRLLRVHDFLRPGRIAATIREHVDVLDAVVAGDADRAAALLQAHIDLSASVVEQRVGTVLSRPFERPGSTR
ncbi:MAG: GntR family transcriptional regulator [Solirubrobacteraceae bacterium]|nr:GntR family transcriptional regulator [Solirubrobacteraceae bacterium]